MLLSIFCSSLKLLPFANGTDGWVANNNNPGKCCFGIHLAHYRIVSIANFSNYNMFKL